jgi:hypothetical protein
MRKFRSTRAIQIFVFCLILFAVPFLVSLPLRAARPNTDHKQHQQYDLILQALEQDRIKNYPDLDQWTDQERLSVFYAGWAQSRVLSSLLSWSPDVWLDLKLGRRQLNQTEWEELLQVTESVRTQMIKNYIRKLNEVKKSKSTEKKIFVKETIKGIVAFQVAFLGGVILGGGYLADGSTLKSLISVVSIFASIYSVTRPLKILMELASNSEKELNYQNHQRKFLKDNELNFPSELSLVHFLHYIASQYQAHFCSQVLR